jgi:hypothetical protein
MATKRNKSDDGGGVAVAEPPRPAGNLDMDVDDMEAIAQEAVWLSRAAEVIFTKMADDTDLSDAELAMLRHAGPAIVPGDGGRSERAFARWCRRQTERIKSVRKLQGMAGTSVERRAASEAAENAEARLNARSAEIADTIAKLQTERAELEQAAVKARTDSDHRQAALAKLREKSILPAYIVDRLNQCKRKWKQGKGRELEVKRNRLAILEGLTSLDISERRRTLAGIEGGRDLEKIRGHIEGNPDFGSTETNRLESFGMVHRVVSPPHGETIEMRIDNLDRQKWQAYLDGPVVAEIESLRKEITALEVEEVEHFAAMATLCDFYVPS